MSIETFLQEIQTKSTRSHAYTYTCVNELYCDLWIHMDQINRIARANTPRYGTLADLLSSNGEDLLKKELVEVAALCIKGVTEL